MPAGTGTLGRNIAFNWNGATIAGVREKGIAVNGEPVDVTDDASSGWRELLAAPGVKTVELSLSGVIKSDTLKQVAFGDSRIEDVTLTYPDGGVIAGDFYLASYNETGPYQDATTFECTLQSTGAVTYTPA